MINILINAYAICPNKGSEPGMGWNWMTHIARHNRVFVITESEFRDILLLETEKLSYKENIQYYFIDVSEETRAMCWDQGDWRFYPRYKKWQKQAYYLALDICRENKIDIIHQLNMVGYREPGYLWKIENIPFVWGPIGGFINMKLPFIFSLDKKDVVVNVVRNIVNFFQSRFLWRVYAAINRADLLISANGVSKRSIRKIFNKGSIVIHETGTSNEPPVCYPKINDSVIHISWAGKVIPRKGLAIVLKSLALVRHKAFVLDVVGVGKDLNNMKNLAEKLGISDCVKWHGELSLSETHRVIGQSDLFFLSSFLDETSTVVLEALYLGTPVLCHDYFGFGEVVDESCGFKIPMVNAKTSILDFSDILNSLNKAQLNEMSAMAIKKAVYYNYEKKSEQLNTLYNSLLDK